MKNARSADEGRAIVGAVFPRVLTAGIGLKMVSLGTAILQERGFGYSISTTPASPTGTRNSDTKRSIGGKTPRNKELPPPSRLTFRLFSFYPFTNRKKSAIMQKVKTEDRFSGV